METWQPFLDRAVASMQRAYAPYSSFHVGAVVRDEHGQYHAGSNVENAAYPEGVCAEASAISAMVAAGGRRITAILVVGEGDALVTPCGGCRQKIREFAAADTEVAVASPNGVRRVFTLDELLPVSFGPEHLAD